MLLLLGASFAAGMLTVAAPCVLPLLPVIIGSSVTGDVRNRKRPFVIVASLAVSLIAFTLLLKATTLLINVPPQLLSVLSGLIISVLGIVTLFPATYSAAMVRLGLEQKAQGLLEIGAEKKESIAGPIIMGAALGPVFSSCSPVYAYILATVLPVSLGQAMVYMVAYVVGLSFVLLGIASFGQKAVRRLRFAANPSGWFRRVLAVVFILVGLLVMTGYDKKVQTWVSVHTPFNFDALSAKLIPSSPQQTVTADKNFNVAAYDAPAFVGLGPWINSQPLTLNQLKGKVVLVDFWTYSCINCIRNAPHLESLYAAYKDKGLVVVGVHAPEFAFEKVLANVQQGVKDQGITYPVAMDNDFSTWNAYHNRYWPAGYLIDAAGQIRRVHYGEGKYDETEQAVRELLQASGTDISNVKPVEGATVVPVSSGQTPETYLGGEKASNYEGAPALAAAPSATFTPASSLGHNEWTLGGRWDVDAQSITARGASTLTFRMASKDAYVVAQAAAPLKIAVMLNGQPIPGATAGADVKEGGLTVSGSRLYHLISNTSFNPDYTVTLSVPDGVTLNVFTFGS